MSIVGVQQLATIEPSIRPPTRLHLRQVQGSVPGAPLDGRSRDDEAASEINDLREREIRWACEWWPPD